MPRLPFSRSENQILSRRAFGKLATTALAGAGLLAGERSVRAASQAGISGIKLGLAAPANPTDDDILFCRQVGVDCVFCAVTPELNSVEGLRKIRTRYAAAGIPVHNIRNLAVTNNQADIILNRSSRGQKIEQYKSWLRTLAGAGFTYTISNFNVAQIVTSSFTDTRGSRTRAFDTNAAQMGIPADVPGGLNLMGSASSPYFGREYSRDEIWDNYTYFIRQVAPVAEQLGIFIGLHPDDPPVPSLFGVPRILSNLTDCDEALKIAGSPNVGICMCCGTWAEGGAAMGTDPAGAIRHFGARRIQEIHYRNVSSSLPAFEETHLDNGYYDLFEAMKALIGIGYDGIVHLDHAVPIIGGSRSYEAFAMGYMRAMRQAALDSVGSPSRGK